MTVITEIVILSWMKKNRDCLLLWVVLMKALLKNMVHIFLISFIMTQFENWRVRKKASLWYVLYTFSIKIILQKSEATFDPGVSKTETTNEQLQK